MFNTIFIISGILIYVIFTTKPQEICHRGGKKPNGKLNPPQESSKNV